MRQGASMKRFKDFVAESERRDAVEKLTLALEHEVYKRIPGTSNSYRQDAANTNTKAQVHSHVYAKLKGGGKELYAVNVDGSGHDGSSGKTIPGSHADFLRSKGYNIKPTNALESIGSEQLDSDTYVLLLLEDA
jgi:hypothetical protein